MPHFSDVKSDFLDKVISVIEDNLANEQFGVSELADHLSMSRSNLLRKVQKLTDLSVSVLIRQVRLHHAKQMLNGDDLIVSEVSHKVGFNSVSYFIKCYREQYGYPPGEESKRAAQEASDGLPSSKKSMAPLLWVAVLIILSVTSIILLTNKDESSPKQLEKSIAVLPFKNDSADSSNVYIVNGLMEAILNNLQKIEDLRVISRTSVEPYREASKTIAEISEELDVNYVLEGSGQKVGDQILLTIQLIEAPRDNHLWSEQYRRSTSNVFELQADVAKDIAKEIRVIITPEEIQRIEKIPTDNLEAYDLYLKGVEFANQQTEEGLVQAIEQFKMAINIDPKFAYAHAYVAICYYYRDIFKAQKVFKDEVNTYSDKAILFDSEAAISHIAKGLFYMEDEQYELAAEYFEKALVFNPNSADASNSLSAIYTDYIPNTEKYLKYALRGIRLDKTNVDSAKTSISYLHLSNALAQTGFMDEAEHYIQRSLAFDSSNLFSQYVYAYIKLAQNKDFPLTVERLQKVLVNDTTRLDIIQEIGKVLYAMEDYNTAYTYYDAFAMAIEKYGLNIFEGENIKIAFVLDKVGQKERAAKHLKRYKTFIENDQSIYRDLGFSAYNAINGNIDQGIEFLKRFSNQKNYHYWFIMMLREDPILRLLENHPDFDAILKKIEDQFWEEHKKTRKMLEEEGLLQKVNESSLLSANRR